jgi:hypothetical protein
MLSFNRENLRNSHEGPWFVLDMIMLGLLFVNLLWLLFDSLYATSMVYDNLAILSPSFIHAYDPIHRNFILVDLVFISIFLTEFCFRWVIAIRRKEHLRWYFFPFLRWYDLVGCIPLGATRIFRFLRIFSILYRLHKKQIIDLNNTAIYRFFAFYYDVFVEELSDRIVVKVLSDAQKDIAAGSPLVDEISQQVLAPRRPIISQWMASMLNHVGQSIDDNEHGAIIRRHVKDSVGKAVRTNAQVASLSYVPVLGKTIENTLEQVVTDIVTESVINLFADLESADVEKFITHGLKDFSPDETALDQEVLLVISECIELLKGHVSQQRWKSHLAAGSTPKTTIVDDPHV